MNITRLITNDAIGSRQPRTWPHRSVKRPPTRRIAAPASGSAITTHSREKTPSADVGSTTGAEAAACRAIIETVSSVLQQARIVDRGRATGPEDGHDDRESDDHLGCRHHHHEEGGDLAVQVAVLTGEGDQR